MGELAGYAPDAILRMVLAGLLGLVAVSCGIALMLDAVRWMAGESRGDPGRESAGPVVRGLKDKVVVAVAIAAIAGSGATLATGAAQSAGSAPSDSIAAQGSAGWSAAGASAGHATTMGEALNQAAEATRGQTFEGRIQQDYEGRIAAGQSAIASAAESAAAGDAAGVAGSSVEAGADLSSAILEDLWLGDDAAGARNLLTGNLLGANLNSWREVANWIDTYRDSYRKLMEQNGAG